MAKKKRGDGKNMAMANPFAFIAEGLVVSERDDVWEEQPVDIRTFIEDPRFCDQKFDGQRPHG